MRLTVEQTALSTALEAVCKGISKDNANVIYGGVLLMADGGTLELTSMNSMRSIRYDIVADVEEPGGIVLPGELLRKTVGKMPDKPVSISVESDGTAIRCGRVRLRLNHIDARYFYEFPKVEPRAAITVPRALFSSMVEKSARYVLREQIGHPEYMGIHVIAHDGVLRMLSTDSYRFFEASAEVDAGEFEATVDTDSMRDMAAMATSEEITIGVSDSQVTLTSGCVSYVGRLIGGTFPNFGVVMSDTHATSVTMDTHEMISALTRVADLAKANGKVEFSVGDQVVTVTTRSPDSGDATEDIEFPTEGDEVRIGFSHSLLTEALRSMGDSTEMLLNGPNRQATLRSVDDCQVTCVMMPVRL